MATMNMGEGGAQGGLKDGQRTLVISVTVAALGSFLFGFDTAVISGTTEALRRPSAVVCWWR